jgi:uncharacterized protein YeeX (DUF496 family)
MKTDSVQKYLIFAITFFSLMCFLQTCGSKGKITDNEKKIELLETKLESKIDSLTKIVNGKPNIEEVQYEMEQTMYDFLLYEDDLDKGKISLSEIKNRIDE